MRKLMMAVAALVAVMVSGVAGAGEPTSVTTKFIGNGFLDLRIQGTIVGSGGIDSVWVGLPQRMMIAYDFSAGTTEAEFELYNDGTVGDSVTVTMDGCAELNVATSCATGLINGQVMVGQTLVGTGTLSFSRILPYLRFRIAEGEFDNNAGYDLHFIGRVEP